MIEEPLSFLDEEKRSERMDWIYTQEVIASRVYREASAQNLCLESEKKLGKLISNCENELWFMRLWVVTTHSQAKKVGPSKVANMHAADIYNYLRAIP